MLTKGEEQKIIAWANELKNPVYFNARAGFSYLRMYSKHKYAAVLILETESKTEYIFQSASLSSAGRILRLYGKAIEFNIKNDGKGKEALDKALKAIHMKGDHKTSN